MESALQNCHRMCFVCLECVFYNYFWSIDNEIKEPVLGDFILLPKWLVEMEGDKGECMGASVRTPSNEAHLSKGCQADHFHGWNHLWQILYSELHYLLYFGWLCHFRAAFLTCLLLFLVVYVYIYI